MFGQILTGEVFAFLTVFLRVGAALMVLPGIGEAYVAPRIRLILALLITALLLPGLMPTLPPIPDSPWTLLALVAGELLIGLFLGFTARLLVTAMEIAGTIVSFQLSLASAMVFNPSMATQGSVFGAFLVLLALTLIFLTDLHHLMLMAVADSYTLFPVGTMPPMGDMADTLSSLVARAFLVGVQISAPFLVIGMIFYIGLGVLARLMPAMQIFFIAIPVQILLGITVLALTLSAIMLYWLRGFEDSLIGFLGVL
ncbi:MAG: flagellar biosynthetic protein FliR [Inquilinaceae bacterium]